MSDTKFIRDKALNDLEAIQQLARVATDPDAHTAPEFDEAYARACAIQDEWAGGMVRLECDEVVLAFETAIEVRRVCRKYDLVPRAKLVEAEERLKQATPDIGPGDPEPPPPTKALEPWTADRFKMAFDEIDAMWDLDDDESAKLARIVNDWAGLKTP